MCLFHCWLSLFILICVHNFINDVSVVVELNSIQYSVMGLCILVLIMNVILQTIKTVFLVSGNIACHHMINILITTIV